MEARQQKLFRFGAYEANAGTGEIRKSGARLRLQEQPFQVLILLLERPGQVVTREELRNQLWTADTFVDFDHGLNTIINKLREVLGDSAANPRFIETLARRGYRFVAPVETVEFDAGGARQREVVGAGERQERSSDGSSSASLLTSAEELPPVRRPLVRGLFLLIQLMYLGFYIAALALLQDAEEVLTHILHGPAWLGRVVLISALLGIPVRLYLLAAVSFDVRSLGGKFLRIFPGVFIQDLLWALAPLLLTPDLGPGLALAGTAALLYVPFAQRTLAMMLEHSGRPSDR